MNNSIILILLCISSIIFFLVIKKKDTKFEILSFLSTMIATLFGVLLAVTLSNNQSIKKEKNDTIKLLNSARNILEGTHAYTKGLGDYFIDIDTINTAFFKKNNPLPYPNLIEPILSNELISKNISGVTHSGIYSTLINLKKISNYKNIEEYKLMLKYLFDLLFFEIEYQKGNINLYELQNKENLNIEIPSFKTESKINESFLKIN